MRVRLITRFTHPFSNPAVAFAAPNLKLAAASICLVVVDNQDHSRIRPKARLGVQNCFAAGAVIYDSVLTAFIKTFIDHEELSAR